MKSAHPLFHYRNMQPRLRRLVSALCCVALLPSVAGAGTTWDGGGLGSSWGTAANWNPDGLPLFNGTEQIVIGSGFASGLTMTLDGTRYIDSLLINTISGFTIASGTGGTLNLRSGNITRQDVAGTEATQTISAGVVLGDPSAAVPYTGTWSVAGGNSLVLSGNISEAGGSRSIDLTGGGRVELQGNNSFSGGLTLTSGSLMVRNDANLGASSGGIRLAGGTLWALDSFFSARALNLSTGGALYADPGKVLELAGPISGNGMLSITNNATTTGGTVILSGAGSNGTGATSIAGGVLSIRGDVTLGTGNLIFSGGILELGNSNFTRALGTTGAGTVNFYQPGGGGFAAWGADRIVNLGGNGATVTWGTSPFLWPGASLFLGSSTANATVDFQNGINLGSATRTVQVARGTGSGPDGKLSGVISGSVSLTVAPNGTEGRLLLTNGNNSYAGSTNIFGGELWLGANATSGAGNTVLGSGSSPVELGRMSGSSNASLLTAGAITVSRNILVLSGNTGTSTLGGETAEASTFTGAITLGTNTTTGHALTLRAVEGGTVTFSGVIADPAGLTGARGALTKSGEGTVVLSGANTFGGTMTVNTGALNVRNSTALGSTAGGTIVDDGAELQLQGGITIGAESLTLNGSGTSGHGALRNLSGTNTWAGNITLGSTSVIESLLGSSLTLAATLSNGGNGADFRFGGAGDTVVSGAITNNADVIKSGTGTLVLAGANTYSGATEVNGGTLLLAGTLNGSAGTPLNLTGDGTFDFSRSGAASQGMGVLTFSSGHGTVRSTYGGSGNTSLIFSALAPRGIGATGNFVVSGGTNGTTNRIVLNGQPSGFLGGAYFFNTDDFAYVDPTGFVRAINYGVDPGTAVSPGGVSLSGNHVKANGHITSQGTQRFETLHINGNLEYTLGANQKVTVGGILKTGNEPGGATISGGAYLQADPNAEMIIGTARENDSLTILTPITANGDNTITKTGAGTLTLSGSNTYTGGTYVSAGTLQIGASERLLNSGRLTVDGGTFNLQNFTETVGQVVLVNGAINGGGAGTLVGSSYDVRNGSASAILGGTAALTKSTEGIVVLTGANTFTGSTTVNGGTLVAAATAGGALANTSAVTVNSGGNLALGAGDQINNAASITLAGGTLSSGGFDEGSSTAVGAGTLSLTAEGSTIDFGSGAGDTLAFAIFDPSSYSLLIDNWTGTAGEVGNDSTDRLIFAADPTASLANFIFSGYAGGAVALLLDGGFYEVTPASLTPVPEINPACVASLLCAGVGMFVHRRRVRAKSRRS